MQKQQEQQQQEQYVKTVAEVGRGVYFSKSQVRKKFVRKKPLSQHFLFVCLFTCTPYTFSRDLATGTLCGVRIAL